MKVLYDHQIFSGQRNGGISRYFAQLLNRFEECKEIQSKVSLIYSENDYIKDFNFLSHFSFLKDKNFKGNYRVLRFFQKLNLYKSILDLKKQCFNIFHPTNYDTYFLKYLGDKPFVFTLYDMIHERYAGNYFRTDDITIERKRLMVKKSSKIIAISEQTKKDVIEHYGIDRQKIEVIYLANSLDTTISEKIFVPEEYILFVGERGGYKNFKFFIHSIVPLLLKYKSLMVVCCGGGPFKNDEIEFFENNMVGGRLLWCSANDAQLVYLYKNAKLFVFPSLYEGFGLPILEAFACGCPTVLSNSSCFPEIAQDAAFYCDPNDKDSILMATEKIFCDTELRNKLILKGLKRCNHFSWKKTADQTVNVYKSVL